MGKMKKLYEKAKNSPSNYRFQDLIKLAELAGFIQRKKRTGTSHHILKHPGIAKMLNLQEDKSGNAKDYQVNQVLDYIDEFSLLKE